LTENRDYETIAERIAKQARVRHALDGMITELGETVDIFKREAYYGKPIDLANLIEELGDAEWYRALMFDWLKLTYGITVEEVREKNIAKLKARFPNKFTEHDALNRDLKAEREILETKEFDKD
jgi:NTP pyrophosphatase (non-canonical NTP hydrolase)